MKAIVRGPVVILLSTFAVACTSPAEVEPEVPAEPATTFFEVRFIFEGITVIRDCDALSLDGEFAFNIFLSVQDADGAWTHWQTVEKTADYGKWNGKTYSRKEDEEVILDKVAAITLQEGDAFRVTFEATEWDGLRPDSQMDNRRIVHEGIADGSPSFEPLRLALGPKGSGCRISLYVPIIEARDESVRTPRPPGTS